jgi:predicted HTH transcriptional regulator
MVRCAQCGFDIAEGGEYERGGQVLCEDCYLITANKVQACDPMAVRSASRFHQAMGTKPEDRLTELQRSIYELVKAEKKITAQKLRAKFSLSPRELENHLSILRHCELVGGQKEGSEVYLVPFNEIAH